MPGKLSRTLSRRNGGQIFRALPVLQTRQEQQTPAMAFRKWISKLSQRCISAVVPKVNAACVLTRHIIASVRQRKVSQVSAAQRHSVMMQRRQRLVGARLRSSVLRIPMFGAGLAVMPRWHAPAGPVQLAPIVHVLPSQDRMKHAAISRRWAATAWGVTTVLRADGSWERVISAPAAHARPAAQAQIPSGRLAAFLPRQQAPSPRQRVRGLRTMPTLRACGAHLDNLCNTR